MSKYLLACPQGHQITIDTSQAGCPVRCSCGAEVIAPTLRGLSQLPRATEADVALTSASAAAPSNWGLRQGLIFSGVILVIMALVPLSFLLAYRPQRPTVPDEMRQGNIADVNRMNILETMKLWDELRKPLDAEEPVVMTIYHTVAAQHRQYVIMAGIGVAVGAVIMGVGLVQPKRKPTK